MLNSILLSINSAYVFTFKESFEARLIWVCCQLHFKRVRL